MGLDIVTSNADALNEVNPRIRATDKIPEADVAQKLPLHGENDGSSDYITTNVTKFTGNQMKAIREAAVASGGRSPLSGGPNVKAVTFERVDDGTVTIHLHLDAVDVKGDADKFLEKMAVHKKDFEHVDTKPDMAVEGPSKAPTSLLNQPAKTLTSGPVATTGTGGRDTAADGNGGAKPEPAAPRVALPTVMKPMVQVPMAPGAGGPSVESAR